MLSTKPLIESGRRYPTNTHYLCVGGGYWGKGATKGEAKAQYRARGGRYPTSDGVVWYRVHEKARVDELGRLRWPKDAAPPVILRAGGKSG